MRLKKPDQKQVSLILAALIPVLFIIGEGIFFLDWQKPLHTRRGQGKLIWDERNCLRSPQTPQKGY